MNDLTQLRLAYCGMLLGMALIAWWFLRDQYPPEPPAT